MLHKIRFDEGINVTYKASNVALRMTNIYTKMNVRMKFGLKTDVIKHVIIRHRYSSLNVLSLNDVMMTFYLTSSMVEL